MIQTKGSSDPLVPPVKAEALALLQRQFVELAGASKSIKDAAMFADPHEKAELERFGDELLQLADKTREARVRLNSSPANPLRLVVT